MKNLLPEPSYLRRCRAWAAQLRSRRSAPAAFLDGVPRRSEAFAEDVEHLTPVVPLVATAQHRGLPAAVRPDRPPTRGWVAA